MESKFIRSPDQALLERIQTRIRWDIRVSNSDLMIVVKDGEVTLRGYFDKPYRHSAALSVITSTEGVELFRDESQVVDDYSRTDKELESLISKQVLAVPFLPGEWINVDVCDGVVKLEGLVFRARLKAFAARASWELSGIKDCINSINLKEVPEEIRQSQPIFDFSVLGLGHLGARVLVQEA
jgi:hyperosmotically inducible periplasmic protein